MLSAEMVVVGKKEDSVTKVPLSSKLASSSWNAEMQSISKIGARSRAKVASAQGVELSR